MADISTSLKVVSIAVSFFAETKRSATFLRSMDNFLRSLPRLALPGVPIEGIALTASSFVMRPSRPLPFTSFEDIPFSSRIFLAAGDGEPVAYVFLSSSLLGVAGLEGASFFVSAFFGASSFFSFDFSSAFSEESSPPGFLASVSIIQTTSPTATTSPSSAFKVMMPLASAGNSSVALSLSTSAIG